MRKKLIEVALPLDAINAASAREKSIRHGHPSTLHLWWARRPLAAARAVIFAQMVDDPSAQPNRFPTEEAQEKERQRLFRLIEELVKWENTTNEALLQEARDEIRASWQRTCAENADHPRAGELFDPDRLPAFHDPFAGGGALPLEAQRLGLEAHASDLNPVAVLINKAMIEIPPKFADRPPVNPEARPDAPAAKESLIEREEWKGAQGLAEDVRYYGRWMRDEAEKRIGHLYPKVEVTAAMARERPDLERYVGRKLTVIAWLWARTVKSPNPAFRDVDVPLASTFMLSTKKGKEAYIEPVIEAGGYRFTVKAGAPGSAGVPPAQGTKLGRGANFRCLMSDTPIAGDYIKAEGQAGRIGARLMAIVAEGERGRVYLAPTSEHEERAREAEPEWKPDVEFFQQALGFRVGNYGMAKWCDIFTPRQLVALTTFSNLIVETMARVKCDTLRTPAFDSHPNVSRLSAFPGKDFTLCDVGINTMAYAEAVGVYLAFALSKQADLASTICHWQSNPQHLKIAPTYARNALPMSWDFAEGNPFSSSSGNFLKQINLIAKVVQDLPSNFQGYAKQADAMDAHFLAPEFQSSVYSTDPPYFDNIGYADMSDFFYVWQRRALKSVIPELFNTLATPKINELVATPARHSDSKQSEVFFVNGMSKAMRCLASRTHTAFPVTIYYAFKQTENKDSAEVAILSTGWETFLEAMIQTGFSITGTWPVRTERPGRMRDFSSNALASSIVLVCRKRPSDASLATRRQFVTALKAEIPGALAHLQSGNIAPVDLAQAAIGPGMAIYTRYARVLDASGEPVSVREALALINQTLDETLAEQEGDFDADSRWALAWFEQHGFDAGEYGAAETLSKAKNTSVGGLVQAGVLASKAGKVRLLKPEELPEDWDPATDPRLTAWETVHQLIRALETGGETAAAGLVRQLGGVAETARELAYRLYAVAERRSRAAEALSYNALSRAGPRSPASPNASILPSSPRCSEERRAMSVNRLYTDAELTECPARPPEVAPMNLDTGALQRLLCERLCEDVRLAERPDGALMLHTHFEFPDGDRFPIHVSWAGAGGVRLSDRGHTLMHVSYDHDIDSFLAEERAGRCWNASWARLASNRMAERSGSIPPSRSSPRRSSGSAKR